MSVMIASMRRFISTGLLLHPLVSDVCVCMFVGRDDGNTIVKNVTEFLLDNTAS